MVHTLSTTARPCAFAALASLILLASPLPGQQRAVTGSLAGIVVDEAGRPVPEATLRITRFDGGTARDVTTDASGSFSLGAIAPGLYRVTARRIGYREATLPSLRIVAGQTADIRVTLAASATQLSTVRITVTPTSIDATTSELSRRITVEDVKFVPMTRDAAGLVDLIPGSKKGFVWGGAGDAANNYQLDGVSVNHPGIGGNFLDPSIDWIEALEVRGLGAGAEYGSFQGGLINAVTKTGSNDWRGALRANYVSPALSASNIRPNEEGAQQVMRRELSSEMRGPLVRDRLFYFVAGQLIDRNIQLPNLITADPDDFRPQHQEYRDLRGIAKLTLAPGARDRIDLLGGSADNKIERADFTGVDDPAASRQVASPTHFYSLSWTHTGITSSLDARVAGFDSRSTRLGYEGDSVPAVRVFSTGRLPVFQNAVFNERVRPRSLGGNITWKKQHALKGGENQIVVGAEYTRGWWRNDRTRNGGLTWFPYLTSSTGVPFNPTVASTWTDAASEWGGEIRLESDVEDVAFFVQDYLTLLPNLTFTPGLRYGRWTGWLTPFDATNGRFLAARHQAFDPRIGVVWDISGTNDFVMKAHWGRYHQGMNSAFFDRAQGADAYDNERFYLQGPSLSDSRTVYTPAQRDQNLNLFTGFSPTFIESILNEAGRVENYRQPYVKQTVLSLEKRFGPRWKAEVSYTNRINKDIVGLVDRNLAANFSPLTDVIVRGRVGNTPIYDQFGNQLVLPVVWVSNLDLRNELIRRRDSFARLPPVPGYSFDDIATLTWEPDIVLTTVGGAFRRFDQLSMSMRTEQQQWSGFGSITVTRHYGNVGGLTGFGTTGTSFTAGPGVRLNEAINSEGLLANVPALEAKTWASGNLPYGLRAGVFATFSFGEFFAPSFQFSPRFRMHAFDNTLLGDEIFSRTIGQTQLLEERGNRKYPARTNLDVRIERHFTAADFSWIVTADLFNALASDAIIQRNLTINDQISTDPTSTFAAPRLRVNPLALQLGMRVVF